MRPTRLSPTIDGFLARGFFEPFPLRRASRLPRPGADSMISEGMPSRFRTPLMYSAALVSLPGGLLVSMRTRSRRIVTASSGDWVAGAGCATASDEHSRMTKVMQQKGFMTRASMKRGIIPEAEHSPSAVTATSGLLPVK